MRHEATADIPVGVEIAGCLVEARGRSQRGCLLGTSTAGQSYPGYREEKILITFF